MPDTLLDHVPEDVRQRAARIRLACFDVDGVLTDGRLTFDDTGRESKSFDSQDGLGLKQLASFGIEVALITARSSPIVARRGVELGLAHVYQGETDKLARVDALRATYGLGYDQVAFTGDDVPELSCMRKVGLAVAVANAHPWILALAHWRTRLPGGHGAAREVCDLLLAAQGHAAAFHARFAGV
jgi:3-deoxy-D-manno-octulosonate 8-phosphate phosphatase (KDO 8-P phosphatase)